MFQSDVLPNTTASEKIVLLLLKPPSLSVIQELRRRTDHDREYLKNNLETIGTIVLNYLSSNGVYWDAEIFKRDGENILRTAINRLRGIQK